MHSIRHVFTFLLAMFILLIAMVILEASSSNKWRLSFSGGADSDGEITLTISPEGQEPLVATIAVTNKTSENNVAKTVVKALKEQLPKDGYHVERDDGEDVLIKKRGKTPNFELEVTSNTVEGVRIGKKKE